MAGQPFKKALGVLRSVAPTAAAALAGPYAPLAQAVIRRVIGAEEGDDVEAALIAAAASPETVVKIREIEQAMKAQEQQLGIRFAELETEDRKDARLLARETSIWPQLAITGIFVVGYFTILGLFFSSRLEVPMSESFMVMLGVLTAGMTQIMAFWFGSSRGSQEKDRLVLFDRMKE